MDDEQRARMRELKRWTWQGVLTGGLFLVLAIALGVWLRDWTAFLFTGSSGLLLTVIVFVKQWRYLQRGPFPRLPEGFRSDDS